MMHDILLNSPHIRSIRLRRRRFLSTRPKTALVLIDDRRMEFNFVDHADARLQRAYAVCNVFIQLSNKNTEHLLAILSQIYDGDV